MALNVAWCYAAICLHLDEKRKSQEHARNDANDPSATLFAVKVAFAEVIFERVVDGCMAADLVKGEGFAADASAMEANGSPFQLTTD